MKIASLHAENVHGYLPINVEFFEDITFLTGLNGSGKTSALRLLMALLTPNIDELGSIIFSKAIVTIQEKETQINITAEKSQDGVSLSISTETEPLSLSSSELELYIEARRRDEPRSPILDKYQQHPIYQRIKSISTPMFLGLDRRFYAPELGQDLTNEALRREYLARRLWPEGHNSGNAKIGALVEVNFLVVTRTQEVRAAQEQLDEKLRAQFFAKAFEYKPSNVIRAETLLPSRAEIDRYREQLKKIELAAEGIKIPVPEIQAALTHFFARMSRIVDIMEKNTQQKRSSHSKKTERKTADRPLEKNLLENKDYFEWIINEPQVNRIIEHLRLLDEYIENRNALRDPINRFLSLVNKFFAYTKKTVEVGRNGQLTVKLRNDSNLRPIDALSSGERQLLVMLAHLSLINPANKHQLHPLSLLGTC